MAWALLWMVGCHRGAVVESVAPQQVPAGERIEVFGQYFRDDLQWALVQGELNFPLEQVVLDSSNQFGAIVPVHTQPGTYDLVNLDGGEADGVTSALVVQAPRAERPCTGEYTINTQLSLMKRQIVIDRFHRGGERETLRLAADDIAAIEYERRPTDRGYCSAIFLRRDDGARILFDDDLKVELKDRAQKMARDLDKPIELLADAELPPLALPR